MNKILKMTYESSLTNLCEVNPSFDTGVLRICYVGENRNKTFISKESLEKALPSIYNCPIVCNYDRDEDTLGGHDIEIVRDNDGNLKIINATTPIGVLPESANVWFENVQEGDGNTHEYLCADALLWKRQEAYQKVKKDGITALSMEIKINQGESSDDGLYHINDFEFTALTLIGVEPCFESAALDMSETASEVFSQNYFKQQISEMMKDLKETFSMVNLPSHKGNDNIYSQSNLMKGGNKTLEKEKLELAAKYSIDINSLDFSLEDFSIEELTEKFEAMKKSNDGEKFSLNEEVIKEIERTLRDKEIIRDRWGDEVHRYRYENCDLDLNEVYAIDRSDYLLYGFKFSRNKDSIVVDFESKKRKKYAIVDFEEGETQEPSPVFALMEEKFKKYSELSEKFSEAENKISTMETELTELRQFKLDTENTIAENKREEVFSQFADLAGNESFEALKQDCEKYDLETLEEKCFAIRGREGVSTKFSLKEKTPKLKVTKHDDSDEPYGGLFVEYANKGSN